MSKATARAIVRHDYSDELKTHIRSRIGYRAEDGNAWKGPWRTSFGDAQRDARAHNASQAVPVPPTL